MAAYTENKSFVQKVLIALFLAVLVFGGAYLIGHTIYFFLLLFGSILMGVLFTGFTNIFAHKLNLNRSLSLLIVIVLVIAILVGIGWYLVPSISAQMDEMTKSLTQGVDKVKQELGHYQWGRDLLKKTSGKLQAGSSGQTNLLSRVSSAFSTTLGALADIVIVTITGLFLAASPQLYHKGVTRLFPVRYRSRIYDVMDKCYETLKWWLVGMFSAMLIIGVSTSIGLSLLGLPLAIALGLIAFLFAFIPNIGPWIAGIPIVLVGFLQGPQMALYAGLVYFGVQMIETYVITPLIFKKTVDIPPALLLMFQVVFGIWAGIIGLLLAAPLLAVLLVIVKELYVKDYLENKAQNHTSGNEPSVE